MLPPSEFIIAIYAIFATLFFPLTDDDGTYRPDAAPAAVDADAACSAVDAGDGWCW